MDPKPAVAKPTKAPPPAATPQGTDFTPGQTGSPADKGGVKKTVSSKLEVTGDFSPPPKKAAVPKDLGSTGAFDEQAEEGGDTFLPAGEGAVLARTQGADGGPEDEEPSLPDDGVEAADATAMLGTQAFTGKSADDGTQVQRPPAKAGTKPPAGPAVGKQLSILGDFRLTKKLGQGGMGAVYKAHQISLERECAVKVLAKHLADNPDFVQRFQREAKIMAKLDHPNILRCHAVGQSHGLHYFAMEFVDGGSMEGWLKKFGKLSVGDALHVVIATAKALQHAHDLTLVHRDIKPDNILLTSKGIVKVADLGLAKATSDDLGLTRTGTGAGTPIYMSPEQSRDAKHVDGRTDIYALGCMLYCFLTGAPPFIGETYVELFEAKERGTFPPARRSNDEIPERLDLIIDKMVAKKVELRYKTCAEVVEALEGLGLATESLSFLQAEGGAATGSSGAASKTPSKAPSKLPGAPLSKSPPQAPASSRVSPPEPDAGPEFWYLSFKSSDGKQMTRKMTEKDVRELIKSEHFDVKTEASRTLKGGYRSLASFREFEPFLRGRLGKARADRKAGKYKSMYAQIEAEETQRQKGRWLRNLKQKLFSGFGLILWLVLVAAVGGLAWLIIHHLMDKIDGK